MSGAGCCCYHGGGGGLVAKSYPTLCDPMKVSLSGSSDHGILQARILEWVSISFSRLLFSFIIAEGLMQLRRGASWRVSMEQTFSLGP